MNYNYIQKIFLIILALFTIFTQNSFAKIDNPESCKDFLIHIKNDLDSECYLDNYKDIDLTNSHFLSLSDYKRYLSYYNSNYAVVSSEDLLNRKIPTILKPHSINSFYIANNFFSLGFAGVNLTYKCGSEKLTFFARQKHCIESAGTVEVNAKSDYFTVKSSTNVGKYDNKAGEASIIIDHYRCYPDHVVK